MTIINHLKEKRDEFLGNYNALTYASVPKIILKRKIDILNELIKAYDNYYNNAPPTLSLTEVQKIFDQQYGFEQAKQKILTQLKISAGQGNIQKNPFIWCLVGPPGTGKTTFTQLLAQALKKEIFSFPLGGMTDSSLLTGKEEEIGLLTNALLKNNSINSLFLFDEIDKASVRVQDSLINVLDSAQNTSVFNHYLDVNLDFSPITFVVTANDLKKISDSLFSRMKIIELSDYTVEQKKEITHKIIQKWFAKHGKFNQNNFAITSGALESLISKTQEKGVRQLERGLDSIFDYCLLQWLEEVEQGKTESKITITTELVNQIIPNVFSNENQEEPKDNNKAELERIKKDLEKLQRENKKLTSTSEDRQEKLAKFKNGVLLLWQRNKENLGSKGHNYEAEIEKTDSWEELKVIKEEILSQIRRKNAAENSRKNQKPTSKKPDKTETEIKDLEKRLKKLEENSANPGTEIKKEIQKLGWIIIFLTVGVVFGLVVIKLAKKKSKFKQ